MTEPNIAMLGFGKLVYDFLSALHQRFPKRKRLSLVFQRFFEVFVREDHEMLFSTFKKYFDQCDAVESGILRKGYSKERLRIINSVQNSNRIFSLIKLDTMFTERTDNDTNNKIWAYLSRLAQVCNFISEHRELIRLVDPLVNRVIDENPGDVEQMVDRLEQSILGNPIVRDAVVESVSVQRDRRAEISIKRKERKEEKEEEEEKINGVKFVRWTDKSNVEEDDPENICCLCFDAKPNAKLGGCNHDSFCKPCLRRMVQQPDKNNCPLCRHEFCVVYISIEEKTE